MVVEPNRMAVNAAISTPIVAPRGGDSKWRSVVFMEQASYQATVTRKRLFAFGEPPFPRGVTGKALQSMQIEHVCEAKVSSIPSSGGLVRIRAHRQSF